MKDRLAAAVGATLSGLLLVVPSSAAHSPAPPIYTGSRSVHRVVALTFDDGPSPYTAQILATLRADQVHATFFLIGRHVLQMPWLVRSEAQSGQLLGNHTFDHVHLVGWPRDAARNELVQTQLAVSHVSGVIPQWFRPPYGVVDERLAALAGSLGLHTVLWNNDPADWSLPGASAIAWRALSEVHPGSIIILHDGGGDRYETVLALRTLIPELKARGYRFVTLDDMFFPNRKPPLKRLIGHRARH